MSSTSRFVCMYVVEAKRKSEFPCWDRRGGCAKNKMAPFRSWAQTGWYGMARSDLTDARAALLFNRCASRISIEYL